MLWVRTQDKKRLINVNDINLKLEDDRWSLCTYTGISNIKLATYCSQRRAIEVLDEIQEKIECYLDDKLPTIYEMPEE